MQIVNDAKTNNKSRQFKCCVQRHRDNNKINAEKSFLFSVCLRFCLVLQISTSNRENATTIDDTRNGKKTTTTDTANGRRNATNELTTFLFAVNRMCFFSRFDRAICDLLCVSVWRDTRHVDCIHQLMEIHNPNALLSFYVVIWLSFFALTSIRTRWDIVSEPMKYFHRPHNSRWHSSSKRTNECDRNYKKSTRKPQNVKYFHSRLFRW